MTGCQVVYSCAVRLAAVLTLHGLVPYRIGKDRKRLKEGTLHELKEPRSFAAKNVKGSHNADTFKLAYNTLAGIKSVSFEQNRFR